MVTYQSNDLVFIKNWSSEGIEIPWGWELYKIQTLMPDKLMKKNDRVKLSVGMVGIIVTEIEIPEVREKFYVLLIGGRQLCVADKFITTGEDHSRA